MRYVTVLLMDTKNIIEIEKNYGHSKIQTNCKKNIQNNTVFERALGITTRLKTQLCFFLKTKVKFSIYYYLEQECNKFPT